MEDGSAQLGEVLQNPGWYGVGLTPHWVIPFPPKAILLRRSSFYRLGNRNCACVTM